MSKVGAAGKTGAKSGTTPPPLTKAHPKAASVVKEANVEVEKPPVEDEDLSGIPTVLKWSILGLICLLGFSIRLFAVVRYESVIHEFDPYFNFRTTKYLAHEGFLEFLNWFDDRGWYPLGRTIGGTIYPGVCSCVCACVCVCFFVCARDVLTFCLLQGEEPNPSLYRFCLNSRIFAPPTHISTK